MKLQRPLKAPTSVSRPFNFYLPGTYYLNYHYAIDLIRMWPWATMGAEVVGPGDGMAWASPYIDYWRGYVIIIKLPNRWEMHVCHLHAYTIPPGVWVPISQGQVLGYADSTGVATGPHVHIDFFNPQKLSPEAVWKAPFKAFAHDFTVWEGRDLGWAASPEPVPPQPTEPVIRLEDDVLLYRATDTDSRWAVNGDGSRTRITPQAYDRLKADGVPFRERKEAEIGALAPSTAEWLNTVITLPGGKINLRQLFEWSRTSEETHRIKWQLGETNFPAGTTPLEAFQKAVREAE